MMEIKIDSNRRARLLYVTRTPFPIFAIFRLGFKIVRRERKTNGRNGGGVCLHLRTNINHKYVTICNQKFLKI